MSDKPITKIVQDRFDQAVRDSQPKLDENLDLIPSQTQKLPDLSNCVNSFPTYGSLNSQRKTP